jgi:5-(carboxyamino)imidazole ribonucleotide synthase
MSKEAALPPGSTIGILGGGQLGRMLAQAAAQLGYRCHIYAPHADSIAAEVAAAFTCADYDDVAALEQFARQCDVITYEFENVPVAPLARIMPITPLRPTIKALEIAQDRIAEKNFIRKHGGTTTNFALAKSEIELEGALSTIGTPAILKTIRMGYDGKGQVRITGNSNLGSAWRRVGAEPVIVEAFVAFDAEFSVLLTRGGDGEICYWDSTRNQHEHGPLIESQQAKARRLAASVAEALDYVGVLTFEFFATSDGPVFNEMAPRVHNSGHWTIEGAVTSQFENHIRAICGLPLGDPATRGERMEMDNLIGDEAEKWMTYLSDPAAHLHLYGKAEAKAGRKMGHLTRLYP